MLACWRILGSGFSTESLSQYHFVLQHLIGYQAIVLGNVNLWERERRWLTQVEHLLLLQLFIYHLVLVIMGYCRKLHEAWLRTLRGFLLSLVISAFHYSLEIPTTPSRNLKNFPEFTEISCFPTTALCQPEKVIDITS